jgi:hypothetical protein
MGIQDAVKWLLPKEDQFFRLIEQQAAVLNKEATALSRFRPGGDSAAEVARAVQEIEHEGDRLVHEVEEALAKSFVTPIDREDIKHLSSLVDDILDLMNEAARAISLYGVTEPSPAMTGMFELLCQATKLLGEMLPNLRKAAYAELVTGSHEIKKIEKEGDTLFRDAVAKLFRDESVGPKQLVRDKEILTNLEEALDACEDTAEYLAHLAVKNG